MFVEMLQVLDNDCKEQGLVREIMSRVQQLRKTAGLNAEEKIKAFYTIEKVFNFFAKFILHKQPTRWFRIFHRTKAKLAWPMRSKTRPILFLKVCSY